MAQQSTLGIDCVLRIDFQLPSSLELLALEVDDLLHLDAVTRIATQVIASVKVTGFPSLRPFEV